MAGRIIVYGATGGIGSATARLLADRGRELHLVARDTARLGALADELEAGFTVGDVTESGLFDRVAEEAGTSCDGLVYAVGTITLRSIQRLSERDFLDDFRINVLGAALAIKAILPALERSEHGASVVLYSSIAASQGFAMHGSIGASKGGVNGLTLSLAAELAPAVRINAIAPSLTRTPLAASMLANQKLAESIAAAHPLERLGTPEEIAKMSVFLLSEDAGWITGQVIGIDGGRSTLRTKG